MPRYLTNEELARLIAAARNRRYVTAQRDHALLCLLANTGCRPGEAVGISFSDLHLAGERLGTIALRPWVRLRRLKRREGSRIDDVPVSRKLAGVLYNYARACWRSHCDDNPLVFPLTVRSLERIFHYYARLAGLSSDVKLYTLRHTAATRALEASGGNVRAVQIMLGHARVTTTEVYTHVRPELRAELAERSGSLV